MSGLPLPMTKAPAIHFIPPRKGEDGRVIGIDVAVRTLLDAFFRYTRHERFFCHTRDPESFRIFQSQMADAGMDPQRCEFLAPEDTDRMADISVLFRADPNINAMVASRTEAQANSISICGLSHTMSSMQVMGTVATAIAQPLQSWDAIVCPSRAIRSVVESLWDAAGQGAERPPAQLPVIPLGIDTERFDKLATPDKRTIQRQALEVADDDIVVLFYGRLSYHNKAHPLPLLLAAERVAKKRTANGKAGRIHLVFYGYFTGDTFREDFHQAAADICGEAAVRFIENTDPQFPDALWAGADIFVSLVDNVQESFGLTPIEAMASGLPAVISDWDGYRDTVRDGVDGFLIPTLAPPPGAGQELVRRYLTGQDVYGEYLAGASQSVSVDIDATADAIERLADAPDLRARMSAAGQRHARESFDWKIVIPAYEALWDELDRRREADAISSAAVTNAITGPAELDPYSVFRGFPSVTLAPDGVIQNADGAAARLSRRLQHRMNMFLPLHLIELERLPHLLGMLQKPQSVADVLAHWPDTGHDRLQLTLVWLVKMGVARYRPAE